ncbi:MAG: hypothetical protein QOG49_701, partial [Frankiaceae bacterium]|nr:hypothetical protein [Frankiaceae bacterium]
ARREQTAALALCAAGGALALLAAGRPWLRSGPRGPAVVGALALAALAGVVGVLASRGRGRQLVGVVLGGLGCAIAAESAIGLGATAPTRWPMAALAGGGGVLAAGLVVAVRGARWQQLAARYDGPQAASAAAPRDPEAALWDALSRGDDPT